MITAKEALQLTEKPEEERYDAYRRSLMETIEKCIMEAAHQGMKVLSISSLWKRHAGLYNKIHALPQAERWKIIDDLEALGYEVTYTEACMDIYWNDMVKESGEDEQGMP